MRRTSQQRGMILNAGAHSEELVCMSIEHNSFKAYTVSSALSPLRFMDFRYKFEVLMP